MRTITEAAKKHVSSKTHAFPFLIVEVQWGSGTVYYAVEKRSDPVAIGGLLIDNPEIKQLSSIGEIGSTEQWFLELPDEDDKVRDKFDTAGDQLFRTPVIVWQWFIGIIGPVNPLNPEKPLTWPDDAIKLFHGAIAGFDYDAAVNVWSFRVVSFEVKERRDIGIRVSRQNFPELPCDIDNEQIIPVVYGDDVRRVQAVLVDRPGDSILGAPLLFHEKKLTIYHKKANDQRFDVDEEITVVVGWSGNYERITGTFAEDSQVMNITDRSGWVSWGDATAIAGARGTSAGGTVGFSRAAIWIPSDGGFGGQNGVSHLEHSYIGHMLAIEVNSEWYYLMVTEWNWNSGGVIVAYAGDIPVTRSGTTFYAWRLSAIAGLIPQWNPGVPVNQAGPWKYIANAYPSKSVARVEGTMVNNHQQQRTLGQHNEKLFVTFTGPDDVDDPDDAFYEIELDNREDFNGPIRREVEGDDPGVTVLTLKNPPTYYGLDPEVYVTLSGTVVDPDADILETATSPAQVLRHLLETEGKLPAELADWQSFEDTQTVLDNAGRDMRLAFALTDVSRLTTTAEKIAMESTARLSVIDGRFTLSAVPDFEDDATVPDEFTVDNTTAGTDVTEFPHDDWPTKIIGKVKRFPDDRRPDEIISTVPETDVWKQDEEREWMTYQNASTAQQVQEFWHRWKCGRQRKVATGRFMDSLAIVPLDIAILQLPIQESRFLIESTSTMQGKRKCCGVSKLWSVKATSLISKDKCDLTVNDYRPNQPTGNNGTTSGGGGQTSVGWQDILPGGCWCVLPESSNRVVTFHIEDFSVSTVDSNGNTVDSVTFLNAFNNLLCQRVYGMSEISNSSWPYLGNLGTAAGDIYTIRGTTVLTGLSPRDYPDTQIQVRANFMLSGSDEIVGRDAGPRFTLPGGLPFHERLRRVQSVTFSIPYPCLILRDINADNYAIYDASEIRCETDKLTSENASDRRIEYDLPLVQVRENKENADTRDHRTVFPDTVVFKVISER